MQEAIRQAVLYGDGEKTGKLTREALSQGFNAQQILDETLTPAMDIASEEYGKGDCYVPEMLISAQAMKSAVVIL